MYTTKLFYSYISDTLKKGISAVSAELKKIIGHFGQVKKGIFAALSPL